jgi:hypothetical protein
LDVSYTARITRQQVTAKGIYPTHHQLILARTVQHSRPAMQTVVHKLSGNLVWTVPFSGESIHLQLPPPLRATDKAMPGSQGVPLVEDEGGGGHRL